MGDHVRSWDLRIFLGWINLSCQAFKVVINLIIILN